MPSSFSGRERTGTRQPSSATLPSLVLQAAKGPAAPSQLGAPEMTEVRVSSSGGEPAAAEETKQKGF